MRTRNSYFPNNSSAIISRRRNKRRIPNVVEPELRTIVEMADNHTMEELLRAPTKGYGEAIIIPEINADHFDIKTNLLQLAQANSDVPNDVTKLMMFPYSLERNARIWYDKEPLNSIFTWEDLVNKFVNQFFPSSKTTHPKKEISRFTQRFEDTFGEAWERFKEMLRAYPHHEFTKLAQIDTFYNGLNDNDQDSLNAEAGGNLLSYESNGEVLPNLLSLHFDISFADALLLMPKFASTIKSLLTNKDKLFELDKIPLNENCSAMLPKKLPKKLGDPGKRSFLRTGRTLIDVYGEEITLRVNDEAITFNLNQTTRYSSTYDDLSVNRIDIIDVAREEYAQEIL
nr:reverse transcriptase domain-containing protein [Tanacetum cinerariifolium]